MNVLLIAGSPLRGGNTAQAARLLAQPLEAAGLKVVRFSVAEQTFRPCIGCNACLKTGVCILPDGDPGDSMTQLYEALDACDGLLWVTPLFFAGVPAQLKSLIDRLQPYFGRRLLYGKPTTARRPAAAVIIGAGGDPFGAQGAAITLRSASQMAEFDLAEPLVITGPDAPGDLMQERFTAQRAAALSLAEALAGRVRARA